MKDSLQLYAERIPSQEKALELMEKLYESTGPASVFSPPVQQGDYVAITAAESTVSLGYGFGGGIGFGPAESEAVDAEPSSGGGGSGGGGGGVATSRPVAVVEIGPNGVRVEPIVDPTKIGIAFFTTFLGVMSVLARARRR